MFSTGSSILLRRVIAFLALLATLAACGPGAGTGGTTSPTTAATAADATTGATAPGATTSGGGGGGGTAQVDLTFTGTYSFTAKGTAGRCIVSSGTPARFGFVATEADYPGLGKSYSMVEGTPGYVDIKWLKDDATSWGNRMGSQIQTTPDHHGVIIDEELAPFTPQGGVAAGPEHVKGTITCP
jgi:hypothetical protein